MCLLLKDEILSEKTQKNVDFTFVYVHRGIAKHLTRYIRVKAHANGVSIRALLLRVL